MKTLLMIYTILLFVLGCTTDSVTQYFKKEKKVEVAKVKEEVIKDFLLPCGLELHVPSNYEVIFEKDESTGTYRYTWFRDQILLFTMNISDARLYKYNLAECYSDMYNNFNMHKTTLCVANEFILGGVCESMTTNAAGNTTATKLYMIKTGKFITFVVIPIPDTIGREVTVEKWLRTATWVK